MRVRRIEVKGLFGVFHHVIPLRMNERVTIIHGPNGFGKTILLEMINGCLHGNSAPFDRIPFDEFLLQFDNGEVITIQQKPKRRMPFVRTVLGEELDNPSQSYHEVHTRLIQTSRLHTESTEPAAAVVKRCSDAIAAEIRKTVAHYAKRAQELDRTFPARVLREETIKRLTSQELADALARQEKKRAELISLGFLDSEEQLPTVGPINDSTKLEVMSIYVHDVDEKFAVFDELAQKLRLFVDILKSRFQYKTFGIHRERGMIFQALNGAPLPITSLSSGEQHLIVLLYGLLFQLETNSLVLIDEPELSLHLLWQQSFLDDLLKIARLAQVDVLVATHSPDIIDAHWNLTEALKGPDA